MAWFEHGSSRIYYEVHGSGEPLLLMPGWAGSIDELTSLRDALIPDFRVIAVDLPGSGKSGPQPRQYTATYFEDDALTLLALLDELSASPAHLVGFSDGGEEALLMAALNPAGARSVVAWGAAGEIDMSPAVLDMFYNLIDDPAEPMKPFAEALKEAYGEDNARVMAQSVSDAWRGIGDAGGDIAKSRVSQVTCPALLITGEHDVFAPPSLVSELAAAMPRGEFVEAKGAGHDVHADQPEWLVATIVGWLAKRR